MKIWSQKYKRRISSITFACYLIVLTLSIFHHHRYNLYRPSTLTSDKQESIFYKTDIASGFDCAIQHNLSQLHNFNLEFETSSNFFFQKIEKFFPSESNNFISPLSSFPNQLRAPPSYC